MKKIFTLLILFSLYSCQDMDSNLTVLDNSDSEEITFIIELNTKENSKEEIEDFTQYLSDFIVQREPSTVYGYYMSEDGKKVTLIERYKNEDAILNHIKNISEGGLMEKDFGKFVDHFIIDSIGYYGDLTKDFKETLSAFGLTVNYNPNIAGFSRN